MWRVQKYELVALFFSFLPGSWCCFKVAHTADKIGKILSQQIFSSFPATEFNVVRCQVSLVWWQLWQLPFFFSNFRSNILKQCFTVFFVQLRFVSGCVMTEIEFFATEPLWANNSFMESWFQSKSYLSCSRAGWPSHVSLLVQQTAFPLCFPRIYQFVGLLLFHTFQHIRDAVSAKLIEVSYLTLNCVNVTHIGWI